MRKSTRFLSVTMLPLLAALAAGQPCSAADNVAPPAATPVPAATPAPATGMTSPFNHPKRPGPRILHYIDQLGLTADQDAQIKAIYAAADAQHKAVRDDATLQKSDKREKNAQIESDAADKVKAVLTADQQTKLSSIMRTEETTHAVDRQLKKLSGELTLTDDETTKIRAILTDEFTQQAAVEADGSVMPAEKRTRIRDLKAAADQQIMNLLTPDQQKQLQALKAAEDAARSKTAAETRAAKRMDQLTTALTLTPDEQAKIKPIVEDAVTKMAALRDDTTLNRQDRQQQTKQIQDAENAAITALLTPDQAQKMADLIAQEHAQHHKPKG